MTINISTESVILIILYLCITQIKNIMNIVRRDRKQFPHMYRIVTIIYISIIILLVSVCIYFAGGVLNVVS